MSQLCVFGVAQWFFIGSWKLDLLSHPDFQTPLPRIIWENKQCPPERTTEAPTLTHRRGAEAEAEAEAGLAVKASFFLEGALLCGSWGPEVGQAWSHEGLHQVLQSALASGRWTLHTGPLCTCLFLLLLAGRQTVILLIASTAAKPPGQQSHLEKWTESSAHRLRMPQTTSPRLQPSFCKKKSLWLWKSISAIQCHKNHNNGRA